MMNSEPRTATELAKKAKSIVIFHNPKAGAATAKHRIDKLNKTLVNLGYSVGVYSDLGDAKSEAQKLLRTDDLRTVVAAGGDGTASLVANHFGEKTPITIYPLGTENLLSKYLGINNKPETVARIIDEGVMVQLDAGEANGKLFLVMASCGFDAEVVRQMHGERTGHITHLSYLKPIWNSIRRYSYPALKIRYFCGSQRKANLKKTGQRIRARWAFVFNMPRYAMGLPIVEHADGLDGKLDLCTFRQGNLWTGLIYLAGIVFRRHKKFRDTQLTEATRIVIESDQEVPYQVDGDPGGHLPLEIKVLPQRLAMLVPRLWTERQKLEIKPAKNLQVT